MNFSFFSGIVGVVGMEPSCISLKLAIDPDLEVDTFVYKLKNK